MTIERFQEVQAKAMELAGEVEWADFPHAGVPVRGWVTARAADPETVSYVRAMLRQAFAELGDRYAQISGRQEVELEAAGLVQAALKRVIVMLWPDAEVLAPRAMLTKFRSLPVSLMQAPADVIVPSMAEQMAGARPHHPRRPLVLN